ncbi:hypothetical protein OHV05_35395 (plasmid) [Kitasatospora sp. NBC_00070]|uniref:hypothetical protein n=1 Tax=Kitasatospora sp. NBC_00070 TaxID=2975962 RepID=UPI00324CC88A
MKTLVRSYVEATGIKAEDVQFAPPEPVNVTRFETAPGRFEEVLRDSAGHLYISRSAGRAYLTGSRRRLSDDDVATDHQGDIHPTDRIGHPITLTVPKEKRKDPPTPAKERKQTRRHGPRVKDPKEESDRLVGLLESVYSGAISAEDRDGLINIIGVRKKAPVRFSLASSGSDVRVMYKGRPVYFEGNDVHRIARDPGWLYVMNSGAMEIMCWKEKRRALTMNDLGSGLIEENASGDWFDLDWEPGRVCLVSAGWFYDGDNRVLYGGRPVKFDGKEVRWNAHGIYIEAGRDDKIRYLGTVEGTSFAAIRYTLSEWNARNIRVPQSEALGTMLPPGVVLSNPMPRSGLGEFSDEGAAPDAWEVDGVGRLRYRGKILRFRGKELRTGPQGAYIESADGDSRQFIVTTRSDGKPNPIHLDIIALNGKKIHVPHAEALSTVLPEGAMPSKPVQSFQGRFTFPGKYGAPSLWETGPGGIVLYRGRPIEFQGKEIKTSSQGIFVDTETAVDGGGERAGRHIACRQYIITVGSDGAPQPIHLDPAQMEARNIQVPHPEILSRILPTGTGLSDPVAPVDGAFPFPMQQKQTKADSS